MPYVLCANLGFEVSGLCASEFIHWPLRHISTLRAFQMKLCPNTNQPEQDIVYTPSYAAKRIFKHFAPTGTMIEPCRGECAFYNEMPENSAWCEIQEAKDFLVHNGSYDWLITNPPWSKIREFLAHAISLRIKNIVFLININALTTKSRLNLIYQNNYHIAEFFCLPTPKEFPQTGFQLAAVHIKQGNNANTQFTVGAY